ncbi:MAG: hypothetical protein WC484_05795, partial [Candidatus Omnitrophota bacterium]
MTALEKNPKIRPSKAEIESLFELLMKSWAEPYRNWRTSLKLALVYAIRNDPTVYAELLRRLSSDKDIHRIVALLQIYESALYNKALPTPQTKEDVLFLKEKVFDRLDLHLNWRISTLKTLREKEPRLSLNEKDIQNLYLNWRINILKTIYEKSPHLSPDEEDIRLFVTGLADRSLRSAARQGLQRVKPEILMPFIASEGLPDSSLSFDEKPSAIIDPEGRVSALKTEYRELYNLLFNPENARRLLVIATMLRIIYPYEEAQERAGTEGPLAYALRRKLYFSLGSGFFITPFTESFRRHLVFRMGSDGKIDKVLEIKIPGEFPDEDHRIVEESDIKISAEVRSRWPHAAMVAPVSFIHFPDGNYRIYGQLIHFGPQEAFNKACNIAIFDYRDGRRVTNLTEEDIRTIAAKYPRYQRNPKAVIQDIAHQAYRILAMLHTLGYQGSDDESTDAHMENFRAMLGAEGVEVEAPNDLSNFNREKGDKQLDIAILAEGTPRTKGLVELFTEGGLTKTECKAIYRKEFVSLSSSWDFGGQASRDVTMEKSWWARLGSWWSRVWSQIMGGVYLVSLLKIEQKLSQSGISKQQRSALKDDLGRLALIGGNFWKGDWEQVARDLRAKMITGDPQGNKDLIDALYFKISNRDPFAVRSTTSKNRVEMRTPFEDWAKAFDLEGGFTEWVLKPGMEFRGGEQWWNGKPRVSEHKGVDLYSYSDAQGQERTVKAGLVVPAFLKGEVVKIFNDFIGQTIVLRHPVTDEKGRMLCSIVAHVDPLVSEKDQVERHKSIAKIADASKKEKVNAPSHLHLSMAWIPKDFNFDEINWSTMSKLPLELTDFFTAANRSEVRKEPYENLTEIGSVDLDMEDIRNVMEDRLREDAPMAFFARQCEKRLVELLSPKNPDARLITKGGEYFLEDYIYLILSNAKINAIDSYLQWLEERPVSSEVPLTFKVLAGLQDQKTFVIQIINNGMSLAKAENSSQKKQSRWAGKLRGGGRGNGLRFSRYFFQKIIPDVKIDLKNREDQEGAILQIEIPWQGLLERLDLRILNEKSNAFESRGDPSLGQRPSTTMSGVDLGGEETRSEMRQADDERAVLRDFDGQMGRDVTMEKSWWVRVGSWWLRFWSRLMGGVYLVSLLKIEQKLSQPGMSEQQRIVLKFNLETVFLDQRDFWMGDWVSVARKLREKMITGDFHGNQVLIDALDFKIERNNPFVFRSNASLGDKNPDLKKRAKVRSEPEVLQIQGSRDSQEDRFVNEDIEGYGRLLAVMDGFGGDQVSGLISRKLMSTFKKVIAKNPGDVQKALKEIFGVLQKLTDTGYEFMGSTLSLVFVPQNENSAYVMIVGDSPVFILKDKELIASPEHRVSNHDEFLKYQRKMVSSGKAVHVDFDYVEDGGKYLRNLKTKTRLSLTRAFGMNSFQGLLILEPYIQKIDLNDSKEPVEILVATDGIFGRYSAEAKVARDARIQEILLRRGNAQTFIDNVSDFKYADNTTAIRWTVERSLRAAPGRPLSDPEQFQSHSEIRNFASLGSVKREEITHIVVHVGKGNAYPLDINGVSVVENQAILERGITGRAYEYQIPGHGSLLPAGLERKILTQGDSNYNIPALEGRVLILSGGEADRCLSLAFNWLAEYYFLERAFTHSKETIEVHIPADATYVLKKKLHAPATASDVNLFESFAPTFDDLVRIVQEKYIPLFRGLPYEVLAAEKDGFRKIAGKGKIPRVRLLLWPTTGAMLQHFESRLHAEMQNGHELTRVAFQQLKRLSYDTGVDETIFSYSNEGDYKKVLKSLRLPNQELRTGTAHIGVSGVQNLDIMAARHSQWGILMDANKRTGEWFDLIGKIFQENPGLSRKDFVGKLFREIERYPATRPEDWNYFLNDRQSLKLFLEDPWSWLSDDTRYEHIRAMFLEGRIVCIRGFLEERDIFEKVVLWMRQHKISLDTFYISNVIHYIAPANLPNFYANLAAVTDDKTLILDAAHPDGMLLEVRGRKDYLNGPGESGGSHFSGNQQRSEMREQKTEVGSLESVARQLGIDSKKDWRGHGKKVFEALVPKIWALVNQQGPWDNTQPFKISLAEEVHKLGCAVYQGLGSIEGKEVFIVLGSKRTF